MNGARRWMAWIGWSYALVGVAFVLVSFVPGVLHAIHAAVVPEAPQPDRLVGLYAAVLGGLTAGLGTMVAGVARALDRGPAAIARAVAVGLLTWYVVDTAGSLGHGSWQNAVANTLFLAPVVLPPAVLGWRRGRAGEVGLDTSVRGAARSAPA